MMVYVDDDRCVGCGKCLDACPAGALGLIDGVAVVDQGKCRQCGACMEVCPVGAILSVTESDAREPSLPVRSDAPVPAIRQPAPVSVASRARKALPWLGAALAFVGREVVPWVAGTLLDAWDRRANSDAVSTGRSPLTPPQPTSRIETSSNGSRHQFRHRGGRR